MDRGGLVLHAVAAVHVPVLVGVDRLHRALPGPHLLVEDAPDHRRRMQAQVLADVLVLEPGAAQQRRSLDRAAGRDHRPRPHRDPVPVGGARLARRVRAPPSTSTFSARVLDEDARAGRVRVGEPCLHRGLLGAEPAAVAAVAAVLPLLAAAHVARHRSPTCHPSSVRPRCSTCSRAEGALCSWFTPRRSQTASRLRAVLVRRECRHAVRGPLLAHVVGRPERGRVVDGRAAAEAAARQQADALVVRRGAPAVHVHAAVALELAAVEVLVVVVAARLEHDHVEAGRRQHAGRRAAARSRARPRRRRTRASCRGRRPAVAAPSAARSRIRAERARVADRVPHGAAIAVRRPGPCSRRAARPCAAPGRRPAAATGGCRTSSAAPVRAAPAAAR